MVRYAQPYGLVPMLYGHIITWFATLSHMMWPHMFLFVFQASLMSHLTWCTHSEEVYFVNPL